MKISELIKNLEELHKEYGDVPVIVFDGADYCPDLEEISYLEPGEWSFFSKPEKGCFVGDRVKVRAIRLT